MSAMTRQDDLISIGVQSLNQPVVSIFAYCSGISVVLFIAVVGAKMFQPWLSAFFPSFMPALKFVFLFLVATMFSHMLIVTFWGLYYLTDRVHR